MKKSEIFYQLFILKQLWEWFVDAIVFPIIAYAAVFSALFVIVSLL